MRRASRTAVANLLAVFWLLFLLLCLPAAPQDFERAFREEGVDGCMAIWDRERGWREHRPELTARRFIPASTFKVPHTLIGLEEGVLPMDLPWDGVVREVESWNQDQTLETAFKRSAAWYYQEVARRVGPERERDWLRRLQYGNEEVGGRVDTFWLDGPLAISPREQVEFLRRLHDGALPVRETSSSRVRELMDQGDGVYAKTGWARTPGTDYGWYVGWVEKQDPTFFALLVIQPHPVPDDFGPLRIRLARKVLGL